jgi:hypothetical protein
LKIVRWPKMDFFLFKTPSHLSKVQFQR